MYKMAIVDDEPLMLEGVSKAMDWEANGYQLIGAFRSPEGLIRFCEKEHPDILLLDITMPEADGISLLKEIKIQFPEISVIMLTAHNEFSYVRDSLRYHADEYLWKPEIGFQDILDCMNHVLEGRRRKEQSSEKKIYEFADYAYKVEKNEFSSEVFKQLIAEIERALDMENVLELTDIWKRIKELLTQSHPSKESLLSSFLRIFYLYQQYFSKSDLQENCVQEKEVLEVFYKSNTRQEFTDELFHLFEKMNDFLNCQKMIASEELKRKIECYIEEHMGNNHLNLMELSKAIGLSYSYCSRIFPEITGKNFSRYLIDVRMEKACEYLKYSSYKIDRIMELVGYIDKSYFVKSFRQYTTFTPFRYREEYRVKKHAEEKEQNTIS
ncbi:MAG: response regulator [Eubacteriales bacterium]|nr:response regulator [Eubacteriales bacterium]